MKSITPLLLCTLLFTACGDDETSDVRTGTFHGGAVSGLHYATATQSGLTDTEGKFRYRSGETVTFSVGGITFGSTAAAEDVTLFDVFGVPIPTDTQAVVQALNALEPLAGVERVINATILLRALDADANPSNGIDLAGRDASLANARVSFAIKTNVFAQEQMTYIAARMPQIGMGIANENNGASDAALAYLFESAGLDAAGPTLQGISVDTDNNGTEDAAYALTLDARSLLTNGTKTSGGTTRGSITLQRDSGDRITSKSQSAGSNGTEQTATYNQDGQATRVMTTTSGNVGGTQTTQLYGYASDGRLTLSTLTIDLSVSQATYTVDGNTVTALIERGATNGAVTQRSQRIRTYDESGRLTVYVEAIDDNRDEIYESTETRTYTYDANDNLESIISNTVNPGGEQIAHATTRYTWTFDSDGRIAQSQTRESSLTVPEHLTVQNAYTYDANGRRETWHAETFGDNGTTHRTDRTTTYVYDDAGTLTRASTNDVMAVRTSVETYTYGDAGNRFVAFLQRNWLTF